MCRFCTGVPRDVQQRKLAIKVIHIPGKLLTRRAIIGGPAPICAVINWPTNGGKHMYVLSPGDGSKGNFNMARMIRN